LHPGILACVRYLLRFAVMLYGIRKKTV